MDKMEFITELAKRTENLPQSEQEEFIEYYAEMISERVEEGMTEEQAVADLGSIDDIAESIMLEAPLSAVIRDKVKSSSKRKLKAWEIVLLAVGSPLWLSLGITAFAVMLTLYIVLWVLVIVIYAVFVSFAASALGCLAASVVAFVYKGVPEGVLLVGAALVLAALAILTLLLGNICAKAVVKLIVVIVRGIKSRIIRSGRKEQQV